MTFVCSSSGFVLFGCFVMHFWKVIVAAEIVPLKSRIRRSSACMSLDHLQPLFGVFCVRGIKLLHRCFELPPTQAKVFLWSYFARLSILRSFCVSSRKVHARSFLYFFVQDPFTLNVYLDPQTGSAKGRKVLIPLEST